MSISAEVPKNLLNEWLEEGVKTGLPNPEGIALASVASNGRPSVRMVLFKGFKGSALTFYSNYESRKAQELEINPNVALVFHWTTLEKQIRVEGRVSKMSREDSEVYFRSRPRGSQIGAWASRQSRPILSMQELETQVAIIEARFKDKEVPLPPWWGGYLVEPVAYEFWSGRPSRLHERIVFTKDAGGGWSKTQLSP
jgi:pyridoxamine 5'-phosphate oxidase